MPSLQVSEAELQPGCRVIRLEGELDLAVADQLSEALQRAGEFPVVLVDLEACEFVDSTGLAVIVHAHGEMKESGRKLALFGANDQVLRVLSVTGLTDNGLVFESAQEALRP